MSFSFAGNNAVDPQAQINRTDIKGRGRVKQVFAYPQLAHVWAQQSQEHGRSPKGQMYFHGATIFSYGSHFPIARFTSATFEGKRVVLFNSGKYSNTTRTHCDATRGALNGLPVVVFNVPEIAPQWGDDSTLHAKNLAALIERFKTFTKRAAKPHVKISWKEEANSQSNRIDMLADYSRPIREYCTAFDLTIPHTGFDECADKIRAAFVRYNDPKRVAARATSQANKSVRHYKEVAKAFAYLEGATNETPNLHFVPGSIKREANQAAAPWSTSTWGTLERAVDDTTRARNPRKRAKTITAKQWRNGVKGELAHIYVGGNPPTLVRRVGNNLETSRGADCPFSHAVIAFLKAQDCRATNTAWHRNGQQIRVGHFNVDSIDVDGNMRAGCHSIQFEEMQRLAIREIPERVKARYPLPVVIS
jgi:hypothetical protein